MKYDPLKTYQDFIKKRAQVRIGLTLAGGERRSTLDKYLSELAAEYCRNPLFRDVFIEVNRSATDLVKRNSGEYYHQTAREVLPLKTAYNFSLAAEEARLASEFGIEECFNRISRAMPAFSEGFVYQIFEGFERNTSSGTAEEIYSDYKEKPQVRKDMVTGEIVIFYEQEKEKERQPSERKPSSLEEVLPKQQEALSTKKDPLLPLYVFKETLSSQPYQNI